MTSFRENCLRKRFYGFQILMVWVSQGQLVRKKNQDAERNDENMAGGGRFDVEVQPVTLSCYCKGPFLSRCLYIFKFEALLGPIPAFTATSLTGTVFHRFAVLLSLICLVVFMCQTSYPERLTIAVGRSLPRSSSCQSIWYFFCSIRVKLTQGSYPPIEFSPKHVTAFLICITR